MAAVEMYTAGFCPFCYRAKALLEQKSVAYKEIRIDGDPQLRQQMMSRANGRHTVPQIFINDRHIGGCDDIMALESNGQLDSMLAN
jgi:glutaredoxin 3